MRINLVHLINVEQCKAVANSQTSPVDTGYESVATYCCHLLLLSWKADICNCAIPWSVDSS